MNHREDFQKRRNMNNSIDAVEEFNKMKNGFLICFDNFIEDYLSSEEIDEFHILAGITKDYVVHNFDDAVCSITRAFSQVRDMKDFCLLVEQLSISTQSYTRRNHYDSQESRAKEKLMKFITKVVPNRSLNIVFEIQNNPFRIVTYPKGERALDETLVNQPLGFLDSKSQGLFIEALKEYQLKPGYKSGEALRKCIEHYLRFKLNNNKTYDNNRKELMERVKERNGDKEISRIISSVFAYLDNYFNENTKHQTEELSDQENEFLIYQVGLLLRYIDRQIK